MRDKKALKELLALDRETLEMMMSSKPFKPRCLDVIVSMHAPHLYSEVNLAEIKNFHQELLQQHSSQDAAAAVVPEMTEDNNNMMVTADMCPQNQDLPEKKIEDNNNMMVTAERSPESDQDLAEEEVIIHPAVMTKKPRSKNHKRVITGKRSRQSDENVAEEEVVINNPVSKKPRSTTSIKLKMNATSPSPSSSSPSTSPSSSNLSPDTSPSSSNPSPSTSPSPSNLSPPPDHTTTPTPTPTPPSSPDSPPNNPSLPSSSNAAPPDMPIEFKNKILELNGTDIVFVMHKTLCDTDVNWNNDRMSMPLTQIACDEFLTEAEKEALEERDDRKKKFLLGLKVAVLDPCLREFTLKLKKWKMKTTSTYNLSSQWKRIVSSNDLKKNQELDIWSFRVQDKLYFIFNKL